MKQSEFNNSTIQWVDRFISTYDRDPVAYWEYIQFCMDTMVDSGEI